MQVRVATINDGHIEYARRAVARLQESGFRVDTDFGNAKTGAKVRDARLQRIPFFLVVGDREVEEGTVAVRERQEGSEEESGEEGPLKMPPGEAGGPEGRIGLALAGGGPEGAVYEVGALRALDEALDDLRALCAGTDAEAIDAGIKALEKRCEFYVERRMNANIRKAMAGHSVNEFEQESE